MRVEREFCTNGEPITVIYDQAENAVLIDGSYWFDYFLGNETALELEAILKEARKGIPYLLDLGFYRKFDKCLKYFDERFCPWGSERGHHIENQTALHAIIDAFEKLGDDGQETLLNMYLSKADLRPRRALNNGSWPEKFFEAAVSLRDEEKRSKGRSRDNVTRAKLMLGSVAYDLFQELGLHCAVTNTGHFAGFVKVLWSDPELGDGKGAPNYMEDYLKEIRDSQDAWHRWVEGGKLFI